MGGKRGFGREEQQKRRTNSRDPYLREDRVGATFMQIEKGRFTAGEAPEDVAVGTAGMPQFPQVVKTNKMEVWPTQKVIPCGFMQAR